MRINLNSILIMIFSSLVSKKTQSDQGNMKRKVAFSHKKVLIGPNPKLLKFLRLSVKIDRSKFRQVVMNHNFQQPNPQIWALDPNHKESSIKEEGKFPHNINKAKWSYYNTNMEKSLIVMIRLNILRTLLLDLATTFRQRHFSLHSLVRLKIIKNKVLQVKSKGLEKEKNRSMLDLGNIRYQKILSSLLKLRNILVFIHPILDLKFKTWKSDLGLKCIIPNKL